MPTRLTPEITYHHIDARAAKMPVANADGKPVLNVKTQMFGPQPSGIGID
jgi:hypothetical protein